MRRPQLSYANVMSTIAVFVALGGTSYAVARNSIGSAQLKRNAVTSAKVKDRSLRTNDLSPSARLGARGPRGASGPQGPPGTGGPPEAWKGLSLAAGWGNYGGVYDGAAYRQDQIGRVHLRGLVTRTDGLPTQGPIGTLPAGQRPPGRLIFGANGGATTIRVDVLPNGEVHWVQGTAAEKDYTSLDAISFWPA